MLKDRDIIIFGDDWGRHPSTMQYIGKVLNSCNRIFWIGSIGMRKPEFSSNDFKRILEKTKSLFRKNSAANPEVILINPFVIPFHDFKFIRSSNKYLLKKKLISIIKKFNVRNFIILSSTPLVSSIIGTLGEKSSFYFCLDDYIFFSGTFKYVKYAEDEILKKSDAAFYFSRKVYEKYKHYSKGYIMPQGVNLELFSKSPVVKPDVFGRLKRPVIGFWGLIDERFDIELFKFCCRQLKEYSFLLIGNSKISIKNELPENVEMAGAVPNEALSDYAAYLDAAIIPYKVNDLTSAINPLKLLEYLAAGLPVVSAPLPAVFDFSDLVYISDSKEEFAENIKSSIKENKDSLVRERKKRAEQYSWSHITDKVSEIIINSENKKLKKNS